VLAVILGAVWIGLLLDPAIATLALGVVFALGLTAGVFLAAMGLGMIGSGVFAIGDRVFAWLRQGSRWPEE
jgi:hypothetical protein